MDEDRQITQDILDIQVTFVPCIIKGRVHNFSACSRGCMYGGERA